MICILNGLFPCLWQGIFFNHKQVDERFIEFHYFI